MSSCFVKNLLQDNAISLASFNKDKIGEVACCVDSKIR